jgi:hypothetical protein
MFRWYRGAKVCYAYLADVPAGEREYEREDSFFRRSRWFTRGWTLQEMLAPKNLVFLNRDWVEIGEISSLAKVIASVTGIREADPFDFRSACVAVKMSWASRRKTTRPEDAAYCLMGLFNINMPLLYGEGERAFIRLQLEILNISNDETIFAWSKADVCSSGLLANSPAAFRHSGGIRRFQFDSIRPPYSMTNQGLRLETELLLASSLPHTSHEARYEAEEFLVPLNCKEGGTGYALAIILWKTRKSKVHYVRIFSNTELVKYAGIPRGTPRRSEAMRLDAKKSVYIEQFDKTPRSPLRIAGNQWPGSVAIAVMAHHVFHTGFAMRLQYCYPPDTSAWVSHSTLSLTPGYRASFGAAEFIGLRSRRRFAIVLHAVNHSGAIDVGMYLVVSPPGSPRLLEEIVESLSHQHDAHGSDRIDSLLWEEEEEEENSRKEGPRWTSVSLHLRKVEELGERVYFVDMAISIERMDPNASPESNALAKTTARL